MMKFTLPLALLAAFAAGCNDHDHGKKDDGHGSHTWEPVHGGTRLDLAPHGPQIEIVHDETAGTITIWAFDPHNQVLKLQKPPVLKIPAGPKLVTATGKDDKWTFTDDLLKKHQDGLAFKVDVNGVVYDQEWHHKH